MLSWNSKCSTKAVCKVQWWHREKGFSVGLVRKGCTEKTNEKVGLIGGIQLTAVTEGYRSTVGSGPCK